MAEQGLKMGSGFMYVFLNPIVRVCIFVCVYVKFIDFCNLFCRLYVACLHVNIMIHRIHAVVFLPSVCIT